MKQPDKQYLEYFGLKTPNSPIEIEFEILGLESAIAKAQHRIAELKQGLALAKLIIESSKDDSNTSKSKPS